MIETTTRGTAPILAGRARYLIASAARAPSVHNTQPWRFRVTPSAIELYNDPRRRLLADPLGREMLISCGAALFGLRLAVRSLGYRPVVDLFPEPGRLRLLARVSAGAEEPVTAAEREMVKALSHRHTHRGAFAPGPLPAGLVARLQHDALTEGAMLAVIEPGLAYQRLADLAEAATRRLRLDPRARADIRRWSRSADSLARDGVPASAFAAVPRRQRGRLAQRDFDLGRGFGLQTDDGPPPAVTAVLVTSGDARADWLRAGQALHRLLLRAAGQWVYASLHTEPLEFPPVRALVRDRLALPGAPQMLLQFGLVNTTRPTGRRPPDELVEP